MRKFLFGSFIFCLLCSAAVAERTIYDAHIHYSEDVWEALPAKQAIGLLKQNGIEKALVSSTPSEGAIKLYHADPDRVLPMLRPYKSWRHRYYWFKDEQLDAYLNTLLEQVPFVGIGEFHVFGDDATLPPVRRMIAMAEQRKLVLHAHTDLPGITQLLNTSGGVVIWAHGGFDVPVDEIRRLIAQFPGLYIELSFREGLVDEDAVLTPQWRGLFTDYPDRFLLGMDTYKPSRWAELPELVESAHLWLDQLPQPVARKIARENFARLFIHK